MTEASDEVSFISLPCNLSPPPLNRFRQVLNVTTSGFHDSSSTDTLLENNTAELFILENFKRRDPRIGNLVLKERYAFALATLPRDSKVLLILSKSLNGNNSVNVFMPHVEVPPPPGLHSCSPESTDSTYLENTIFSPDTHRPTIKDISSISIIDYSEDQNSYNEIGSTEENCNDSILQASRRSYISAMSSKVNAKYKSCFKQKTNDDVAQKGNMNHVIFKSPLKSSPIIPITPLVKLFWRHLRRSHSSHRYSKLSNWE